MEYVGQDRQILILLLQEITSVQGMILKDSVLSKVDERWQSLSNVGFNPGSPRMQLGLASYECSPLSLDRQSHKLRKKGGVCEHSGPDP